MRKLWQREKGLLRGFTLSELMVMMAVFSILATIATPLYANAQARARICLLYTSPSPRDRG